MTDKPKPSDATGNHSEIKQSLTIPYAVLLVASTVITGSVLFWINRTWENWTVEKKTLLLTTVSSQNLATAPAGASALEFRLVLSPTDKRIIKSVFSYEVAIHNQSHASVENLALHLYPPGNVKLIDPPKIVASSKILADFVSKNKHVSEKEIVFDLDLLGPGELVTLAYSGYSEEAIDDPSFIDVETRKNGWEVLKRIPEYDAGYDPATDRITVSRGLTYTVYAFSPDVQPYSLSVLSKPITAYNGADVIALVALLITGTCVSGFLIWLLARVLSGWSNYFRKAGSLLAKLFRHAG